tara:strand:- start:11882 stop:14617 length:2736 start_codon:yes stop_codon:yes gene_type:complete
MIQIHIEKMTMGFRIHIPIVQAEAAVLRYAERLHAPKLGRDRGRVTTEVGDPFYLRIRRDKIFYFHLDHLQPIKDVIAASLSSYMGTYEFVETTLGHVEPYKTEFKRYGFDMVVDDPESRFFYQNEVVDTASDPDRFQTIFAIQTGRGKMLPNDTPVRIPGGWKTIGELEVGEDVIGRDGKPAEVLGVYPQPEMDMYDITFQDGRVVRACKEHLWQSFYVNTTLKRRWQVRDTLELKRLISMPNPRVYIPLIDPEETSHKDFLIDPYVLGIFISNVSLVNDVERYVFETKDDEIVDRVLRNLPADGVVSTAPMRKGHGQSFRLRSRILDEELERLGLQGKHGDEKFIPAEYLEGSIEQRWALMQGLMDGDGTVNKDGGQAIFNTNSNLIADGIQTLAWSLGAIAKRIPKQKGYTYKGKKFLGKPSFLIAFQSKKPSNFFYLKRKKEITRDNGQYCKSLKLKVMSVEPAGKDVGTCIAVNNEDHLFVVKDYVATHNTKSAMKTMVKLGTRTVIIVRPSYIDKWEYDTCRDKTGLKERRKRVYIVKGVQGISDMLREGRDGVLDKRRISTIMIPTTSLQLWIKDYCERPQDYTWLEIGDFYNLLKAGLVLHDEIHEHFLLVYLSAIAMNPPRLLEMSATIDPSKNKQFICERYLERFPLSARLSVDYIPVVDVAGIYYSISDPKFNAKANRMKLYSHTAYEKNLYQHGIIDQYFEMVYDLLQRGYLNNYQSGQRALVFFSLVQTCKDFKAYVDKRLAAEGHKLTTAKYNSGDSYDKFMAADIGISTPGKAGTAIDIPGLVLALVTIPIDDKQLNEQITGRPREVTAWDLTPKVLFLHCVQVSKHNRYLRSRKRELEKIVKSFKIAHSKYDLKGGKPRGINSSIHRPNIKRIPLPNSKGLSNRRGGFKGGRKKW